MRRASNQEVFPDEQPLEHPTIPSQSADNTVAGLSSCVWDASLHDLHYLLMEFMNLFYIAPRMAGNMFSILSLKSN